jgi:hypothetical protein
MSRVSVSGWPSARGWSAMSAQTSANASKSAGVSPAAACDRAISRISATYRCAFVEARATSYGVAKRSPRSAMTGSRTPCADAERIACAISPVKPL